MESERVPNIILLQGYEDANTVVAGVLSLKGCQVHKTTDPEDCLSVVRELEEKADAVLIQKEIAVSKDTTILKSLRKFNPAIIVIVLADNRKDESTLTGQGIDEFVQTPVSSENLADKILMLIAKKELKKIKASQIEHDPVEQ